MKIELIQPKFAEAFLRYWSDRLFEAEIIRVRAKFIQLTARKELSGVSYTVLCILLAQAMENLLNGYSGSSYNLNLFYEAVGFSNAYSDNSNISLELCDEGRYTILVNLISKLQKEEPEFASLIERVLALDFAPPVVICKHCKAKLTKVDQQWHCDAAALPQYCWIDFVSGSRLHEV